MSTYDDREPYLTIQIKVSDFDLIQCKTREEFVKLLASRGYLQSFAPEVEEIVECVYDHFPSAYRTITQEVFHYADTDRPTTPPA